MSGIYIKGMEMPKTCFECKLLDYTGTYKCRYRYESLAKEHGINISRPDWCPLVPVPPHGDLIDRSELRISTAVPLDGVPYQYIHIDNINNAPSIIPADSAEEGEG